MSCALPGPNEGTMIQLPLLPIPEPAADPRRCHGDAVVAWRLADGSTVYACERHRLEMAARLTFVSFALLRSGTARCEWGKEGAA